MFKSNRFIRLLFLMFVSFSGPLMAMDNLPRSGRCSIQSDCSICFNDCDSENDFITPCCRQVFHFACLNQWVAQRGSCPWCRRVLNTAELLQENEKQIRAREERERLAIEEERQIQEAIRLSIEEENQNQIKVIKEYKAPVKDEAEKQIKEVQEKQEQELNSINHVVQLQPVNAYIHKFKQRSDGMGCFFSALDRSFVIIRFDQEITNAYFCEFINVLDGLIHKLPCHYSEISNRTGPLTFTYRTTIGWDQFQSLLDQANNHFACLDN